MSNTNALTFVGAAQTRDVSELVAPTGPLVQPEYVRSLARAHERAGFDQVLVGESSSSPDALTVAGRFLAGTDDLGVLVTSRPGITAPTAAARALATLAAFHPGRVGLHLPAVHNDTEPVRDGDHADRAGRQRRRREFAEVVRRAWSSPRPFDHDGEFYRVAGSWSAIRPAAPLPLYVSGSSASADALAGAQADVYLLPATTPDELAERIAGATAAADAVGRTVRFGLRLRPIIGSSPGVARSYAERVVRVTNGVHPSRAEAVRAATGAVAGVGSLAGTVDVVAGTLLDYIGLGISVFHLSGYEPLADAERFGDLIRAVHTAGHDARRAS